MAKIIRIQTVITQIIQDGYIKPKSPLYMIVNDGDRDINLDKYLIRPGASFSINIDSIAAYGLEQNIPVVNDTNYQITFLPDPLGPSHISRVSAQLIEIFIKKED